MRRLSLLVTAFLFSFAAMAGKAPGFSLKGHDGKTYDLKTLKGKVVVLEWTNHECPFVQKHYKTGNMQKFQEQYVKQGVVWLTVNSSAKDKAGYLADAKMATDQWHANGEKATAMLMDSEGAMGKAYGAKTTPHMFVIGKDGELVYQGAIDNQDNTEDDKDEIAKATNYVAPVLDKLLAAKKGERVPASENKAYGCSVKY